MMCKKNQAYQCFIILWQHEKVGEGVMLVYDGGCWKWSTFFQNIQSRFSFRRQRCIRNIRNRSRHSRANRDKRSTDDKNNKLALHLSNNKNNKKRSLFFFLPFISKQAHVNTVGHLLLAISTFHYSWLDGCVSVSFCFVDLFLFFLS